jgi:hypothetical protein
LLKESFPIKYEVEYDISLSTEISSREKMKLIATAGFISIDNVVMNKGQTRETCDIRILNHFDKW